MTGITRFLGNMNNGMRHLAVTMASFGVIAVIVALAWIWHSGRNDGLSLWNDDKIDCTPTVIESMRAIGQWEFLEINDEEIIDTVRTGFFSDDELVRIYYGTLRLGIDLSECSKDWIRVGKDTIHVTIPQVKLLDYNFIDEARTRSFFETGRWSNADRKALYEKARRIMLQRSLNDENIAIAQRNATEQIARMLQPIAEPKVVKVTMAL